MAEFGSTIGDYSQQTFLGQGGFAHVYRAIDSSSNQRVALKVIDKEKLVKNEGMFSIP